MNDAIQKPLLRFENITWTNEGKHVQGWLLYPQNYDSTKKYPMLVCVHGGPAWITTPTWAAPDFNTTVYTQLGYFIFFPNRKRQLWTRRKFYVMQIAVIGALVICVILLAALIL